jgi:SAM-dependent methyltransferase
MINTIAFKGDVYPQFQASGNASRFVKPFAIEVCVGNGYDIGANRKEWAFPGAVIIDPQVNSKYDAMNLPDEIVDYIFSSHCLEHVNDWVRVLDHWTTRLRSGGVLFLYLPDFSQKYWRPWNNTKHVNCLSAELIKAYLEDNGYKNIFSSGIDLNNSFTVMAEKI